MRPTRWEQFKYARRLYAREHVRPAWWHALVFALTPDGSR